jgi:hypothetical protein
VYGIKLTVFTGITNLNFFRGSSYIVKLGANRLDLHEVGSHTVLSAETIVHPNYVSSTLSNDIALIRLPLDVQFTSECEF